MKALSLFDGMACGALALQAASIEIESYDAFEIDTYATKTASHNFPFIKHHGDVFKADFTQFKGVDLVCGGSPCTYWSIAQKNNRETEASGMGWELFQQYVRAIKESEPKYFVYENNKSMSKAIRASIDEAFGFEAVLINSALVSAQNRQRLYWVGKRNEDGTYSKVDIEQPVDRGILLCDVLDGMTSERIPEYGMKDKARTITASYAYKGSGEGSLISEAFPDNPNKQVRDYIAQPVNADFNGDKSKTLTASYYKYAASDSFKKANPRMGIAEPVNTTPDGKSQTLKAQYCKNNISNFCCYSSTYGASGVAESVRVGALPRPNGELSTSQAMRIYSTEGKSVNLTSGGGGLGGKTGLYAIPIEFDGDIPTKAKSGADGKIYDVYEVKNGLITIRGKQYEIKLADGFYIIRKLTVSECKRLQTVPEWYEFPVSDTQAYKMLGNGWTVDVIAHILTHIKENERTSKEMELKIQNVTFPEVIEFNFEELKTEITAKVESYKSLVYTDEQIGVAKTDLANLRKFTKALSDERIKVKNECLKPYVAFEAKIKELTAVVDEGISNIDKQVKEYAEQKKSEKLKEIVSYFNESDHPEWLYLESIFSEKWLNASVKMSAVYEEINARLEQVGKDLNILREMPEFAFEAEEVYKMSLDINKAITEGKRLADIAKRKAEQESAKVEASEKAPDMAAQKPYKPDLMEICFRAYLTVDDAKALKEFFNSRNIQFEKI